jgi:PEGA domain-containing protein/tetratricopeptide repeat protein
MATALAQSASIDAAATPAGGDAKAKTEARTHFDRGVQLGHAGDYRQAAAEFRRAYQLAPHYAVLYNLAQVQIALAQPVDAVDTLQRYLTEGGSNVPADRRAEVLATIKQEQAHISMLMVDTNMAGAAIMVDGVSVGRSPLSAPVRVARGKHQVTAELAGYRAVAQTVAAEDKVRVAVVLERATAPAAVAGAARPRVAPIATLPSGGVASAGPPGPPVPGPAPQSDPAPKLLTQSPGPDAGAATGEHVRRTAGFVTGGIGVAIGAAALGCYLWNRSRFDDYEAAKVDDPAKADSIRSVSALTVGLAIGSGVLVATGAVLVLTAPRQSTTTPPLSAGAVAGSAVAIGPRGISWRATW